MRRLFVAATVCAAVLLVAAPAALALTAPLHRAAAPGPADHDLAARSQAHRAPTASCRWRAASSPAAAPSASTCTAPTRSTRSRAPKPTGGCRGRPRLRHWATGHTDADGHVDLTGVPPPPAPTARSRCSSTRRERRQRRLRPLEPAAGQTPAAIGGLQPGRLPVTQRPQRPGRLERLRVRGTCRLWAGNSDQVHLARTDIARHRYDAMRQRSHHHHRPGDACRGSVVLLGRRGRRVPVSGIAVSSGTQAGTAVRPSDEARRPARLDGTVLGLRQARPRTWLALEQLSRRLGQLRRRRRRLAERGDAKATSAPSPPRGAPATTAKRITIPSTAKPGYAYWIGASTSTAWPAVARAPGSRSAP